MDNKDPWVSYDKVSTSSDAFAYVQEIGNDLSDSLEHLNQGSPVRAKGLPTEKYTAGNTNDVMEGVHEESFLTQTPSKISRRYSPMSKSEYSGYRPPDPVFLSYNNNQTTNTFLPEPLAKHKTVEDIDKIEVNNKFVVNKLSSATREAAIAPEALELINILNPVEAREIQNSTTTQEIIAEKYTSTIKPIEVKKIETKTNTIVQKSASIVVGKPKTLITNNKINNNNTLESNQITNINKEVNEVEATGPTFNNNVNQSTNINPINLSSIEVKKPVITPKISQYTNTIDFNSFVSSTFAEIVDQKTEQKILSKNNINVRKLVTDINFFLEQNKKEFKNNISNSVNQFFSTYSEENLTTLQSSILNTISNSNNIENLNESVSRVVNEYFSKNQNEFNQSLVAEFVDSFNTNLQTQITNLQNNSTSDFNIVQNINNVVSDVQNIYESKQAEISQIISEVTNENVLSKVIELANTYQSYQSLTTQSISNISSQVNQTNLSELKETFNQQVNVLNVKNQTSLSNFKQEIYGFLYTYLSNNVDQDVLNNVIITVTNSNSVDEVNSIVNEFASNIRTEENSQTINSLQYFSNDKYSNIVSSLMIETVENNVLNSLTNLLQKYTNQESIQNTLASQVKNEIAKSFSSEVKNTLNNFSFTELRTSIENVYKLQDINEFKSEFNDVLNKSENSSNSQAISYLNNLLENNLSQYTAKSANILNETKYANSVKNLVNEKLHNVVSNIVNNLSQVKTYSDNKNISTLLSNIKIINEKLLINNSENRLQNFNLIQNSIENFLNNTENNYNQKLSQIKLNTTNINPEISTNINVFESLKSEVTNEHLLEIKNIISNTNTQNFNEESKNFIDEVKLYTDLINMKNQIILELDNFVSNTFETILDVNQNSTLVSSHQIVSLVEEAVSSFNTSNVSSKAITYIQNVLQDVKKPELYNNTFQIITSTNILDEQVKNYLLKNNSVLADYSLQQIMNTINQPLYSNYATFHDIKEIINKTTSTSSFGVLSEIKQYINQINSEENSQFVSNLKTYLTDNQASNTSVNNANFTDELKYFISEQNSYSPEAFNQVINSVTNKFENKSALILNEIINNNVAKLNQVLDTLYSSVTNNQSKESVLNTLSTFVNNLQVSNEDTFNNNSQQSLYSNTSFKFDQEFKDIVEKIATSTNTENIATELNTFKQEIFNNAVSTVNEVMNQSNTKVESYDSVVKNQTLTVDEKIENILKTFNVALSNQSLSVQEIKNIELVRSYLLSESYKIELINQVSSQDSFDVNKFDQEFRNTVQNIVTSTNTENIATELNTFKEEVFNNALSTVNEVMTQSNTKVESYDSVVQNQTLTVDEKIQNILKTFNVALRNQTLSVQEIKNIESARNYLLSESYKIEALNKISSQDSFVVNKFDEFENEITTKIQQYLISPSFVENVNSFRTQISQKNSMDDLRQYSSQQKNVVLNDVKNLVSDFVSVVNPEYLTTENLNTINNASSIEKISNLFKENNNQFTTSENSTISSIINQSSAYSQIVDSVTNSILNDRNFTENTLMQKVDNAIYNTVQNQFNTISTSLIQNVINKFEQSYATTNTFEESVGIATSIVNNSILNFNKYFKEVLNSFKIENIEEKINNYNQDVIRTVNTAVQNYDVSKLLTNTINENISMSQSIVNSDVIENINQVLQENNISSSESISSKDLINNVTSNQLITQQIQNTINSNTVRNLFNRSLINELTRNTSMLRTVLSEKTQGSQINLNTEYLNKISSAINNVKTSTVNDVKNEVEKIENITLSFENQNNYQRSNIKIYNEVSNKTETSLHPDFDKVSLNETSNTFENVNNSNDFRNITVVKQIDENEDVQISNLRIEKVWNKFVQEEVSKIVEEVHNSSEYNNQENTYNKQNTTVNQNNNTESFNKSEFNYSSDVGNNTENLTVYNTFNNQQPGTNTTTQETEERINYREVTELVFNRIEEKLKTFNVTEEDIIILRHKILSEVTEIYEKRSKFDIQKSEEKMKKEVQELFIKFLNS